MKTLKIREALTVVEECVDAKLADAALAELNGLEADRNTAALRDTFAAAALTGLCADSTVDLPKAKDYAVKAYAMADAMLAARKGK